MKEQVKKREITQAEYDRYYNENMEYLNKPLPESYNYLQDKLKDDVNFNIHTIAAILTYFGRKYGTLEAMQKGDQHALKQAFATYNMGENTRDPSDNYIDPYLYQKIDENNKIDAQGRRYGNKVYSYRDYVRTLLN